MKALKIILITFTLWLVFVVTVASIYLAFIFHTPRPHINYSDPPSLSGCDPVEHKPYFKDIRCPEFHRDKCGDLLERGLYLADSLERIHNFSDPINHTDVPLVGSVLNYMKSRHVPYQSLWQCTCQDFILRLTDDDRQLNVFITVGGHASRYSNLNYTLEYLIQNRVTVFGSVTKIIIIEMAQKPTEYLLNKTEIDYIYVPMVMANYSGSPQEQFPKALLYNFAYFLSKLATWNLFFDTDIIIPPSYFGKIAEFSKYYNWFVTYMQIDYLSEEESTLYKAEFARKFLPFFRRIRMGGSLRLNAKGGAVVVSSNLFNAIGGFDPEINYGYSPEDWWLDAKLEVFQKLIRPYGMIVKHLYHHKEENRGKLSLLANQLLTFYESSSRETKLEYCNWKKQVFTLSSD
eukprot:TRINITY_DN5852_c0_g1_i1.p1 TRINITY_DN5852_c0_g1~~TRINITY_DN5852_c0_g1_i1.p1  ORF type:complete len:403 (-),score=58.37 TRINITY_DN5852_c0_g1_i1:352-1560(-)